DYENQLLPHVAVDAGLLARLEELHVGFDAHLARVHLVMDEMLDQAVGGILPRHVLRQHDVWLALVGRAEILRRLDVVGTESRGLVAGERRTLVFDGGHVRCSLRDRSAARSSRRPSAALSAATRRSSGR